MTLNRRQLFRLAGFTASTVFMGTTAGFTFAKEPEFCPPTKEKPLILSFNENPLGMSERAKRAMAEAAERASRYPFVQVEELRQALADYMGGKPDQIMPSHGSAEAIRAAIEAFNVPGKTVLIVPELSYSDGADVAKRNNIPVKYIKMGPNWSIDVEAMRKAAAEEAENHTVIVYFVNPNNPTSTIADSNALFDWIKSKPKNTFFVLDEAYAEFVNDPSFRSTAELVKEGYDNLVLLKTFSKIFAMAGLRLGFAFATPEVIRKVKDHVAYDIMMNQATVAAALAELEDKEFLKESKESNDESRKILYEALDELKIPYLPSQTNFVFIDLKAPLQPFADRMKEENILVGRPFPPADEWCRITLGTPSEMRYFVKKLKEFREKGYV